MSVTRLSDYACNGMMITPEQALTDALEYIGKRAAFKNGKKILILGLDDTDENFNISFIQAGMKMSECVALCDCAKSIFKKEMNY